MIRRITPRAEIRDRFGIDDQWPVVCEPFTQWVLQDTFAADRPAYERAGVQVVGGRLDAGGPAPARGSPGVHR